MLKKYIYETYYSIPNNLCNDIILMYELENIKKPGSTLGGINKSIKDTTDMLIPKNDSKWKKIECFLNSELQKGLKTYIEKLGHELHFVKNIDNIHVDYFLIQKYNKQSGKYLYHNDFYADIENKRYRIITFLWYLNNVKEGGETEFWGGEHFVKPEIGKLLLFPSFWSFPHCGKMPISDDKYIITGWFYINA